MNLSILPRDSIIRDLITQLSITEVPHSYQIACGLSSIGALIKRSVYVDEVEWRVYPNLSVLLIGPSGVGKDSMINHCIEIIQTVDPKLRKNATTIEFLHDELVQLGELAAAYVPAQELTAFLGGKDYQKGIVSSLTDLLSTGSKVPLGTKKDAGRWIIRPTITMHAGSTPEWLQNLPENSLAGGFLPRFLIVCEDFPEKHVAWPKYDNSVADRQRAHEAGERFIEGLQRIVKDFGGKFLLEHEVEMTPTPAAEAYYRNWYCNRFSTFGPYVKAYANRARGHVHRLAMLMALSRFHGYLDEPDYMFAVDFMTHVADGINNVIAPMMFGARKKFNGRSATTTAPQIDQKRADISSFELL